MVAATCHARFGQLDLTMPEQTLRAKATDQEQQITSRVVPFQQSVSPKAPLTPEAVHDSAGSDADNNDKDGRELTVCSL